MKNPIKNLDTRRMLATFGLEPRRSTASVVGTGAGLLGAGLALGAGGYWLATSGVGTKLFSRLSSLRKTSPVTPHAAKKPAPVAVAAS